MSTTATTDETAKMLREDETVTTENEVDDDSEDNEVEKNDCEAEERSATKSANKGEVSTWDVATVGRFLQSLELQRLVDLFKNSAITGADLLEITQEDLVEIGVTNHMHRKKILGCVHRWQQDSADKVADKESSDELETADEANRSHRKQPSDGAIIRFEILRVVLTVCIFFFLYNLAQYYVLDPMMGRKPFTPMTQEEMVQRAEAIQRNSGGGPQARSFPEL